MTVEDAIAAADLMVATHRAFGQPARAVMLDESGRLIPTPGSA
jgi:hypothetical protein